MLGRQSCPLKWRPSSFTQYINGRTVSREDNVPTQMVGSKTIDVNWARCCHSMIFRRTFFLKRVKSVTWRPGGGIATTPENPSWHIANERPCLFGRRSPGDTGALGNYGGERAAA